MTEPDPTDPRARVFSLLQKGSVREAVREYRDLIRQVPDDIRLRLEFSKALTKQGWKEEAFQELRQALSRAKDDAELTEVCLDALGYLDLPAARGLATERRVAQSKGRRILLRVLLAGAVVGAVLLGAAILFLPGPPERQGPDLLCAEFPKDSSTSGLAGRAQELKIARVGLFAPDGRELMDKTLPGLGPQDWDKLQSRLDRFRGKAIFSTPPSIKVNRWCTMRLSKGRVTASVARSHAP